MEVLNARETFACMVTISPSFIGCEKETLFTDAVTTTLPQCLCAAIAEAMSIQCNNRPPIRLPSVLVSFGKTNSVMMAMESLGVLGFRDTFLKLRITVYLLIYTAKYILLRITLYYLIESKSTVFNYELRC